MTRHELGKHGMAVRWQGHQKGGWTPYSLANWQRIVAQLADDGKLHIVGETLGVGFASIQKLVRKARLELGVGVEVKPSQVARLWLERVGPSSPPSAS